VGLAGEHSFCESYQNYSFYNTGINHRVKNQTDSLELLKLLRQAINKNSNFCGIFGRGGEEKNVLIYPYYSK